MCSQLIIFHTDCSKKKARDRRTPDSDRKMPVRFPTPAGIGIPGLGVPSFGNCTPDAEERKMPSPGYGRATTGITAKGFSFDPAAAAQKPHVSE